jgi:hypothetical protein
LPFDTLSRANGHIVTIPQYGGSITLNGHQSKILVTDFKFGQKNLLYSTAEILTYAAFGNKETLVLWVPTGESGEFTIEGVRNATVVVCDGCSNVSIYSGESNVTITFQQDKGSSLVELEDGSSVVLLDRTAAYKFWAPQLNSDPFANPEETGICSTTAKRKG